MRNLIASILIYIGLIQPADMTEVCDIYELLNDDGVEILICYEEDGDIMIEVGDRNKDEVELVPWGPEY